MAYSKEDKDLMLTCLEETDFHKTNAVELFREKCNDQFQRATLYRWINDDDYFKPAFKLRLEKELDAAEMSHKYLRDGLSIVGDNGEIIAWQEKPDRQAIESFLSKFAKHRGWKDEKLNVEVTGSVGVNISELTTDELIKRAQVISKIKDE